MSDLSEEVRFELWDVAIVHKFSHLALSSFNFDFFNICLFEMSFFKESQVTSPPAVSRRYESLHFFASVVNHLAAFVEVVLHVGVVNKRLFFPHFLDDSCLHVSQIYFIKP